MKNLAHAARPLANDLASSILFAGLMALHTPPAIATLCAIGFAVGHIVLWKALRKPVATLQWASLGLVLVLGTATLFLHDPRFVMAKPTVVYLIIAGVMLQRGWMLRYIPPIAAGRADGVIIAFGYVWAALMAVTAAANLVVAIWFTSRWPLFTAVFPVASKVALFGVQYLVIRAVVRPQIVAEIRAARAAA